MSLSPLKLDGFSLHVAEEIILNLYLFMKNQTAIEIFKNNYFSKEKIYEENINTTFYKIFFFCDL